MESQAERGPDMGNPSRFDLDRFVVAQAPVFPTVLAELKAGQKRSHWMWFIFPQLRGLGHSSMAQFYGIASIDEARAYLAHPLLGPRLTLCSDTMLAVETRSLHEILRSPDDTKFRSSMTLFSIVAGSGDTRFERALNRFCGGCVDDLTSALLNAGPQR